MKLTSWIKYHHIRLTKNKITRYLALIWLFVWTSMYYDKKIDLTTYLLILMFISFAWSFRRALGGKL